MNFDRETLTELALEGIDAVHDMDVTHADYARSIADTILAALPGMIAPLVWVKGVARTSVATYIVAQMDNEPEDEPEWFVYRNGKPLGALGTFDSEESACVAVETHHRAAIMAAFTGES